MQGFLFSSPPAGGQGRSRLSPGVVVVAYEPLRTSGQQVLFSWPVGGSGWGAPAPFRIVLLYEDLALGKRARRACRVLAGQVSEGGGFDQGVWCCEPLPDAPLQSRLACEVAGADLVVLSVYRDLPAGTGPLLGAWLEAKRCRDSALVAIADGANAPAAQPGGSASVQLARLARDHGLTIFCERLELPDGLARGSWEVVWVF